MGMTITIGIVLPARLVCDSMTSIQRGYSWPQEGLEEESAVRATFREKTLQLAEVSEAFHEAAVDFLSRLLHPDPAQRMTAEGALQHRFLTNDFRDAALDAMPPMVGANYEETTQACGFWDAFLNMKEEDLKMALAG
jgi:hypothetical protein